MGFIHLVMVYTLHSQHLPQAILYTNDIYLNALPMMVECDNHHGDSSLLLSSNRECTLVTGRNYKVVKRKRQLNLEVPAGFCMIMNCSSN
jgi:hypothetical protein